MNPGIITPSALMGMLGVKCPKILARLPIPRCYLVRGGKKYVYLASDVLAYLESQRETGEAPDFEEE